MIIFAPKEIDTHCLISFLILVRPLRIQELYLQNVQLQDVTKGHFEMTAHNALKAGKTPLTLIAVG